MRQAKLFSEPGKPLGCNEKSGAVVNVRLEGRDCDTAGRPPPVAPFGLVPVFGQISCNAAACIHLLCIVYGSLG